MPVELNVVLFQPPAPWLFRALKLAQLLPAMSSTSATRMVNWLAPVLASKSMRSMLLIRLLPSMFPAEVLLTKDRFKLRVLVPPKRKVSMAPPPSILAN
ncbi:MAG: hypothetical protein RIS60_1950 [Pseudomonadota bacterium]